MRTLSQVENATLIFDTHLPYPPMTHLKNGFFPNSYYAKELDGIEMEKN